MTVTGWGVDLRSMLHYSQPHLQFAFTQSKPPPTGSERSFQIMRLVSNHEAPPILVVMPLKILEKRQEKQMASNWQIVAHSKAQSWVFKSIYIANSYFPRYLGVYLCIPRLYLYVGNGNKAAVRNEMHSFLWSCKVTSMGPMKCPLLYDG